MSLFETMSPLQMPHILELISSNLPTKDLRSCAKVCQLWRIEMNRALLKRKFVRFPFPQNEKNFKRKVEKYVKEKFTNVLIDGHLPREDIYLSKSLTLWGLPLARMTILGFEPEWSAPLLYSVLKNFSPNLQRLTFVIIDAPGVPNTEGSTHSLLSEIRRIDSEFQYPNLKCLRYRQGRHKHVELTDLCYIFPSLEHLEVTTRGRDRPIALYELKSSEELYWQSLKVLIYDTHVLCCTPLLVLLHLKLNLETFALKFAIVSRNPKEKLEIWTTFRNLLSQMHSSLNNLDILKKGSIEQGFLNCSDKIELDIDLPHLPNLMSLQVFPGKRSADELFSIPDLPDNENLTDVFHFSGSFVDLHLSFKFPNLQEVSLIFPKQCHLSQIKDYGCFPTVKFLTLHPKNVDDKLFHRLNAMFPSLQFLCIDTACFTARHGKDLNKPQFAEDRSFYLLTDTAITGIDQEDFNQLPRNITQAENIPRDVLSAITKRPSLASFKNLLMATINLKYTNVTIKGGLYGPWEMNVKRCGNLLFDFTSKSGYKEFCEYHGLQRVTPK